MLRLRLMFLLCALLVALHVPGFAKAAPKRVARKEAKEIELGTRVAKFARKFVGVPYVWGGMSPRGFDCSGLTAYVYSRFGISLPHYTVSQMSLGRKVPRRKLAPGDLLFFGSGHEGLYIGRGRFIHAPRRGTRVRVESLRGWYGHRLTTARRVLPA